MSEAAHTKSDPTFPGYVNLKHQDGAFVLTVRGDPKTDKGIRVCGQDCLPGGPHCNNYCGVSAGEQATRAETMDVTTCGQTVELRLSAQEMVNWMLQAGILINEIV